VAQVSDLSSRSVAYRQGPASLAGKQGACGMTDQDKLALAQHVLASIAQALVLLRSAHQGDTLPLPAAWVEQWLGQARAALCALRRQR
jgi:hypothetical protein